jgi:hypothetical protein
MRCALLQPGPLQAALPTAASTVPATHAAYEVKGGDEAVRVARVLLHLEERRECALQAKHDAHGANLPRQMRMCTG